MTTDSGADQGLPDPLGSRRDLTGTRKQHVDEAQSQMLGFAIAGVFFVAVGVAVAIAAWPGTESMYSFDAGEAAENTGSLGWAITGLIAAGIGQLFLTVAVIAYGVMLGVRAADIKS